MEFNERGGSTEVVLVHEGFANDEERGKHEHGWTACLEKFAKLF